MTYILLGLGCLVAGAILGFMGAGLLNRGGEALKRYEAEHEEPC
jgi:hypothetical protein